MIPSVFVIARVEWGQLLGIGGDQTVRAGGGWGASFIDFIGGWWRVLWRRWAGNWLGIGR
jgi:hypothetical protein